MLLQAAVSIPEITVNQILKFDFYWIVHRIVFVSYKCPQQLFMKLDTIFREMDFIING